MDELKEKLYELAYSLDFYLESEEECRMALFTMARLNENASPDKNGVYDEEDFYLLKNHINENF